MAKNKRDRKLDSVLHYHNGTPRNRKHITDNAELTHWEYQYSAQVSVQIKKHPWTITSLKDLQVVHRALFHKFFNWAGQLRSYQIQKRRYQGSNKSMSWFLRTNSFNSAVYYINHLITDSRHKSKLTKIDFANLIDSINYLHPFSNGNGRATKVFLQLIALNHHQRLNYEYDVKGMNHALQQGDLKEIAKYLKLK